MENASGKSYFRNKFWMLVTFFFVFFVYILSPKITPYDSRWSIHTCISILNEFNTDLDEFKKEIIENRGYATEKINGHYYNRFPIGVSLLALPFVLLASIMFEPLIKRFPSLEIFCKNRLAEYGIQVDKLDLVKVTPGIELIIASFICATTAVFIFLIARRRLTNPYALLVTFIFAFCTSSWSTSSRALWQHGPSMLMLTISIYFLLLDQKGKFPIYYIAIPLSFAFLSRPTNSIPIFIISLYILIFRREYFIKYIILSIPFAIGFFSYNYFVYGKLFSPYYMTNRFFIENTFLEGLLGNLLSPSRGLFIFSPVLILFIFGFIKSLISSKPMKLDMLFMIIIVCHWLMISCFSPWWGGHCYGPRFFADIIPFFMYFICIFFESVMFSSRPRKTLAFAIIIPLMAFSFYVNYKGAFSRAVYEWNVTPSQITAKDNDRLWDWTDIQFMR